MVGPAWLAGEVDGRAVGGMIDAPEDLLGGRRQGSGGEGSAPEYQVRPAFRITKAYLSEATTLLMHSKLCEQVFNLAASIPVDTWVGQEVNQPVG